MAKDIVVKTPEVEECDFCSSRPVRWAYPCRDFTLENLQKGGSVLSVNSSGEWAACDTCHKFIECSDRDGLTAHSLKVLSHRNPLFNSKRFAKHLRELHDKFWSNRMGAPTPIS